MFPRLLDFGERDEKGGKVRQRRKKRKLKRGVKEGNRRKN